MTDSYSDPEQDPRWPAVVRTAQRVIGRKAGEGNVIRSGTALLVRFGPVLMRAWEPARASAAAREAIVAQTLSAAGVPAVRLIDRVDQPIVHPEAVVTVWQWIDEVPGEVGPAELGAVAGHLRRATEGIGGVPPFDPLTVVRSLIRTSPAVGATAEQDLRDLGDMVADIEPGWHSISADDPAGSGLVHGDLHRLNVLRTDRGPVLADLEVAGLGPASYDTAPAAVAVRRYGADPAGLDAFIEASGHDPRPWPGFHVCCRVYELWVTAWAIAGRAASAELDAEADLRMETLRGSDDKPWKLY